MSVAVGPRVRQVGHLLYVVVGASDAAEALHDFFGYASDEDFRDFTRVGLYGSRRLAEGTLLAGNGWFDTVGACPHPASSASE